MSAGLPLAVFRGETELFGHAGEAGWRREQGGVGLNFDERVEDWFRDDVLAGHAEFMDDPLKAIPGEDALDRIKRRRSSKEPDKFCGSSSRQKLNAKLKTSLVILPRGPARRVLAQFDSGILRAGVFAANRVGGRCPTDAL